MQVCEFALWVFVWITRFLGAKERFSLYKERIAFFNLFVKNDQSYSLFCFGHTKGKSWVKRTNLKRITLKTLIYVALECIYVLYSSILNSRIMKALLFHKFKKTYVERLEIQIVHNFFPIGTSGEMAIQICEYHIQIIQ